MSRYFKARIQENLPLNKNHSLLSLEIPGEMKEPLPGQFYMLGVARGYDPLLKRAFSLYRRLPEGIQILYRIKGKGTAMLKEMRAGEVIDVLGPLGSAYPLPSEDASPVIVAGGIGMASVNPLIEKLGEKARVIYGARTGDELLMQDDIMKRCGELMLCTDDGSCGAQGTVLDVLRTLTGENDPYRVERPVIYACGPAPMLREIAAFAASRRIPAYVSLEENMACGVGACLGCVVKTSEGYKRVCKEGPVFNAEELLW